MRNGRDFCSPGYSKGNDSKAQRGYLFHCRNGFNTGAGMKLIDRFMTRELLVNVLFAIFVLSLVLVVGNIFRKLLPLLVNHDVPVEYLLSFIAYVLPFSLIFTMERSMKASPKFGSSLIASSKKEITLAFGSPISRARARPTYPGPKFGSKLMAV